MARQRHRSPSRARIAAFDTLFAVASQQAYANLELGHALQRHQLDAQQAAQATELVNGTARLMGSYDRIIAAAGGRGLASLQPAVVTVLRLASHELLSMRTPTHAAVDEAVNLARHTVGQRVTGLVNAIARKIAAKTLPEWVHELAAGASGVEALAIGTHHPQWIAQAYVDLLGPEAEQALQANNVAPVPTLVVRPGLASRDELVDEHAQPTPHSPHGVIREGNPADLAAVRQGRAGVQDEGSQLLADLLARVPVLGPAQQKPWLDVCAGPGGKSALLTGLARQQGRWLLASEVAPHRARLVSQALRCYPDGWQVVTADGTAPAWQPEAFGRVMADLPCTGLGSLRRRPESRWRRTESDLADLTTPQRTLLDQAWLATAPGGVLALVTCSPHRAETVDQLQHLLQAHPEADVLPAAELLGIDQAAHPLDERAVQLWPHRHGTDAMFGALVRKPVD